MLLTWTLCNYRSFANETTLDLQRRSFYRNVPKDGDWSRQTERAVGIYGANASGKSTVLRPLAFIQHAVAYSLQTEEPVRELRSPHKLSEKSDTVFEIEYTIGGPRYHWKLTLDDEGIVAETLRVTHTGHWRLVYSRTREDVSFGPTSGIPRAAQENIREFTLPWTLTLSAWSRTRTRGKYYAAATWWLDELRTIDVLSSRDDQHDAFLQLLKHPSWLSASTAVVRAADTGVEMVHVDEQSAPPEVAEKFRKINEAIRGALSEENIEVAGNFNFTDEEKALVNRNLIFTHTAIEERFTLPETSESTGTRAWFDLAMQAVMTIATGGVLVIDELDSSLHPHLVAYFIRLFSDLDTNESGAQLLFTTHDVTLLDAQADSGLHKSSIWFTEKRNSRSELISLDEFNIRTKHNVAKRYLQGVYGAVPHIPQDLRKSISKLRREYLEFSAQED